MVSLNGGKVTEIIQLPSSTFIPANVTGLEYNKQILQIAAPILVPEVVNRAMKPTAGGEEVLAGHGISFHAYESKCFYKINF